jgi:hypothetical protein
MAVMFRNRPPSSRLEYSVENADEMRGSKSGNCGLFEECSKLAFLLKQFAIASMFAGFSGDYFPIGICRVFFVGNDGLTSSPRASPFCRVTNRRAHSWAPEHASMPITHGDGWATSSVSFARDTVRRIMTAPRASTPWTENTFFAKSIPAVETKLMGLPLSKRLISQFNPGTSVSPRDGEVPYIR